MRFVDILTAKIYVNLSLSATISMHLGPILGREGKKPKRTRKPLWKPIHQNMVMLLQRTKPSWELPGVKDSILPVGHLLRDKVARLYTRIIMSPYSHTQYIYKIKRNI